jgi:hypothetical protein
MLCQEIAPKLHLPAASGVTRQKTGIAAVILLTSFLALEQEFLYHHPMYDLHPSNLQEPGENFLFFT